MAPLADRVGVVTHVDTHEPIVALTFDDGPHPEWTPRVLAMLERYHAHATFFMVGEMAARHPGLVAAVVAAGHAIGNHSWNHPSLPTVSVLERARQIGRWEAVLGEREPKLFRPPFGDTDGRVQAQLLARGYRVIGWNVSASDWQRLDGAQIFAFVDRVVTPGSIVLMHDHLFAYAETDEWSREPMLCALELMLIRARFEFVTVQDLLARGRPRGEFWHKRSDAAWLRSLASFASCGFLYY
jgi:peptidoglycan/xylan/chitin deacetylase (PgdA/CDA1 family)